MLIATPVKIIVYISQQAALLQPVTDILHQNL